MDESKKTLTYDEVFSLPLGDLSDVMERAEAEAEKDAGKSNIKSLISDCNDQLEDAIVDFIKNVNTCTKATPNKIRAVRLGFESSKSTTRRLLKEHYSSEKLVHLGKLACLVGCGDCPALNAAKGILPMLGAMPGMPAGMMPGKGVAIDASKLPPEMLQQFENLVKKMAEAAEMPDGEVTKVGDLELRKPPKADKLKTEMEQIDDEIDSFLAKKRKGETKPDADQ